MMKKILFTLIFLCFYSLSSQELKKFKTNKIILVEVNRDMKIYNQSIDVTLELYDNKGSLKFRKGSETVVMKFYKYEKLEEDTSIFSKYCSVFKNDVFDNECEIKINLVQDFFGIESKKTKKRIIFL